MTPSSLASAICFRLLSYPSVCGHDLCLLLQANLCRGLVSRLLEEVFTCMQDVHEGRSREEEYQQKEAHKVGRTCLHTESASR